jgi:hypothetical protein
MAHRIEIRSTEREQLVDVTSRGDPFCSSESVPDGALETFHGRV